MLNPQPQNFKPVFEPAGPPPSWFEMLGSRQMPHFWPRVPGADGVGHPTCTCFRIHLSSTSFIDGSVCITFCRTAAESWSFDYSIGTSSSYQALDFFSFPKIRTSK